MRPASTYKDWEEEQEGVGMEGRGASDGKKLCGVGSEAERGSLGKLAEGEGRELVTGQSLVRGIMRTRVLG